MADLLKKHYAVITAVLTFTIYLITLAPTVIHLDAGELAAVQSTLGIAHPTGYPLFTIIGFLFSNLLFPFQSILAVNLLAALYCSVTIFFIIKSIEIILEHSKIRSTKNTEDGLSSNEKMIAAVTAALSLAFSETFWMQSTSTEVYSLHLLLLSATIFNTLKAYFFQKEKYWYFSALTLALGFSNHMTTLLILPGIAFLFFKSNGFNKTSYTLLVKMLGIFFPLLLIIYSYLPLRAAANPVLNWGNPVDVENFLRHVSGKQYQVWIFSSIEAAGKQFAYFIKTLPQELGYIGLIASAVGLFYFFRQNKSAANFFLINFIATVFYSINYDIPDIDSYFLLAYISLIFMTIGVLTKLIKHLKSNARFTLLLLPLIIFSVNFSRVDQSDIYTFEDYTKNILDKAAKNSVVFSYQWDAFISPSYYFQYVEDYRSDVAVIDKELLRRSWYYKQMGTNFPEVVDEAEPEIKSFLKSVQPFERNENFNAQIIERNFRQMMTALISTNLGERDFYITPELVQNEIQRGELSLPKGYTLVPLELFLKVVPANSGYVEADPLSVKVRYNNLDNAYQKQVRGFVSTMLVYRMAYELQFGMRNKAFEIYEKLQTEYPEITIPQSLSEQIYSE